MNATVTAGLVERMRSGADFFEKDGDIGMPILLRQAADTLTRIAAERDEWRAKWHDNCLIADAAYDRAEAAEQALKRGPIDTPEDAAMILGAVTAARARIARLEEQLDAERADCKALQIDLANARALLGEQPDGSIGGNT